MFQYELKGKQVLLALENEFLAQLKPLGVPGSPVVGVVHSVEEHGLWLDVPQFPLCPANARHLYGPQGEAFCHAHVFIPGKGIISVVAFPEAVSDLASQTGVHAIGFQAQPAPRAAKRGK